MKRILITGSAGFLGSYLVNQIPDHFEVYGTVFKSPSTITEEKCISLDLSDLEGIERTLHRLQPNIIIHAAAVSSEALCKQDPHLAYLINVGSVDVIANWTFKNRARLIFTSSDLVFDGNHAPYGEGDPLRPLLQYGCLKAQAEQVISDHSNAVTLRLPLLYGIGYGRRKGILWDLIERCNREERINLFKDEFRTPLYARDCADYIWKLCDMTFTGTIHIGGRQRLSRVELGRLIFRTFHLDENLISEIRRADVGMGDRPRDTSLNINKALSHGFAPMDINLALCEILKEWNEGI